MIGVLKVMKQDDAPLERVMALVRDLRTRCSWDRVQTRETLRPYLVEEVLELDHAIAEADRDAMPDELGDMLLHLAWQLVLAEEDGLGTPTTMADRVVRKMQRRHPHLFDLGPPEPWEVLKRRERTGGTLDGVPRELTALRAAMRLQERAASVGFDWPDVKGPEDKVREETGEVTEAIANGEIAAVQEEVGDLLFAVVNLARKAGVDPTAALEGANRKFTERFREMEALAAERGIVLHEAGLEALDRLWEEIK